MQLKQLVDKWILRTFAETSILNLRRDGDEKHVAGFEYDVTSIAHPDTAG